MEKYLDGGAGIGGIYNSKNLAVYSYSHNNPVVYMDPDGEIPVVVVPLALAGGGAILGVTGMIIGDLMRGERSSWQEYVGAAVGGATVGLTLMAANPVLAGAAGGITGNITKQVSEWISGKKKEFNINELAINMSIGAALGVIPGAPKKGITLGKGSLKSISKQIISKIKSGRIKNIRFETLKKTIRGKMAETSAREATLLAPFVETGIRETREYYER